ncbi:MAG TPA: acyltransferase family protein [Opitutaceae bacterium]|jgi:peptidoglycan/LPS O-acetylase OafA/YrhL|nr:acyltransferase family protein [Opitutaceae bacterium]
MKRPAPLTFQLAAGVRRGVRLPQFDALKGLAMALVLEYHWHGAAGLPGPDALKGEVGVDIFLLASGILLGINSQDLQPREFLQRRFLRIYPAYWFALALFLCLNAHFFGDHRPWQDIALHVAGLHGFGRPEFFSSIDDSFWFISIIVLLYGAFLVLRRRLGDLGLLLLVGGGLTLLLADYYDATQNAGGGGHLAVRVPTVFLGLILGRIASGRPLEFHWSPVGVAGIVLLAYLALMRWYVFEYALIALAWTVAFLAADRWLRRRHGGRVLLAGFAALGVYSYEIYLLHQPLIRDYDRLAMARWWQIVYPTPFQVWVAMLAGAAVTAGAAWLLHRASEALFRRRRPAPPADRAAA